jgi:hypothetical protein
MRKGNWKLALLVITVAVAVCAAGMLVSAGEDACYNDVEVSGAGSDVNETYVHQGMYNDRPYFLSGVWNVYIHFRSGRWSIYGPSGSLAYLNWSQAETPPSSGWEVNLGIGEAPIPTVSGGGACNGGEDSGGSTPSTPTPATVAITGDAPGGAAAFLDVVLAGGGGGGDESVMGGLLPLAAIHTVGDAVTGGSTSGPIHVYIYSVDITTRPESVVLASHWAASYNRTAGEYEFSWDTSGMAPGYYDVRLSFGTYAYNFRIQLI